MNAWGTSWGASWGDSWGAGEAAAPVVDGPWRELTGEYPKPQARRRVLPELPPLVLPLLPPSVEVIELPAVSVVIDKESPFREILLADDFTPVPPRPVQLDDDELTAVALLLAA